MAPQAWSQAGSTSGSGSAPGSQKSDAPATGSQRGTTGSGIQSQRGTTGAGGEMQTQREPGSAARAGAGRMSKEDVKQVQAALKNKGMDPGPEDGVMGPKTQQALREFQKSNNLPVTGRIDEKTASALGVDVASGAGGSTGMGTPSSGTSGAGSPSTPTGAGGGMKSGGSSQSSPGASGASQSSSGAKGGTTANPPSKPTGRE